MSINVQILLLMEWYEKEKVVGRAKSIGREAVEEVDRQDSIVDLRKIRWGRNIRG